MFTAGSTSVQRGAASLLSSAVRLVVFLPCFCGGACSPHVPEVSRHYRVVVKAFAFVQCGPVRSQAGAQVGVTLTILQTTMIEVYGFDHPTVRDNPEDRPHSVCREIPDLYHLDRSYLVEEHHDQLLCHGMVQVTHIQRLGGAGIIIGRIHCYSRDET